MKYNEIAPPAFLKNHVRYFWTLESDGTGDSPVIFRPLADGCPGLMYHQSTDGSLSQFDKKLPEIFVYGQTTAPTEVRSSSGFRTTGVVFFPHALKTIFGLDADILTNSCADVTCLAEKHNLLSEQLFDAKSAQDEISILASGLFSYQKRNNVSDNQAISYAVSEIIKSKGVLSFKDLLKNMQLSERTFERRFRQWIGVSPKLFARICQFQSALNQMKNNDFSKLSDIAFENDYADQSHFIRSFKEFSGFSPFQYQKQSGDVAKNFLAIL